MPGYLRRTSQVDGVKGSVERWFAELQRRCLDRGVFCSLDELTTALEEWIKIWNASARPFKWTKTADPIIDRICRYCSRISGPGHQEAKEVGSNPSRSIARGDAARSIRNSTWPERGAWSVYSRCRAAGMTGVLAKPDRTARTRLA
jgi:hypothetical protein